MDSQLNHQKKIPTGTIIYDEDSVDREYEIWINERNSFSSTRLDKANTRYEFFNFSHNNKYLIISSKNIFKTINLEKKTILEKKLDEKVHITDCAIANDGQQLMFIYNENKEKKSPIIPLIQHNICKCVQ